MIFLMALPIVYRNAIRKGIKNLVNNSINEKISPESQATNRWKYTNSADFHFGHFIGMSETLASNIFQQSYKRQINQEEMREVQEIIEEESKPLREYFISNF